MISVLVAARPDSKYLAKFLFSLFTNTVTKGNEVRVMLNQHDTWNKELVEYWSGKVWFSYEDKGLGRSGLHLYFNDLAQAARGDWLVYFCEDHHVNTIGWDRAIKDTISGDLRHGDSEGKQFPLDPDEPWVIVPKWDTSGAMNHVLSKGFVKAIGDMGKHGWIDSYLNELIRSFPDRVIRMDNELFHDFTESNPMAEKPAVSPKFVPKFDSQTVRDLIGEDARKLKEAL